MFLNKEYYCLINNDKNLKTKDENILQITLTEDFNNINNKEKNLKFSKKLFFYSLNSEGKLDIYLKAHILKQILIFLKFESLNASFFETLKIMEKDILDLITIGETERLTEEKYLNYVEIFVKEPQKIDYSLKHLKKILNIFQNLGDTKSIKLLEKLFIQLLGHSQVI